MFLILEGMNSNEKIYRSTYIVNIIMRICSVKAYNNVRAIDGSLVAFSLCISYKFQNLSTFRDIGAVGSSILQKIRRRILCLQRM